MNLSLACCHIHWRPFLAKYSQICYHRQHRPRYRCKRWNECYRPEPIHRFHETEDDEDVRRDEEQNRYRGDDVVESFIVSNVILRNIEHRKVMKIDNEIKGFQQSINATNHIQPIH